MNKIFSITGNILTSIGLTLTLVVLTPIKSVFISRNSSFLDNSSIRIIAKSLENNSKIAELLSLEKPKEKREKPDPLTTVVESFGWGDFTIDDRLSLETENNRFQTIDRLSLANVDKWNFSEFSQLELFDDEFIVVSKKTISTTDDVWKREIISEFLEEKEDIWIKMLNKPDSSNRVKITLTNEEEKATPPTSSQVILLGLGFLGTSILVKRKGDRDVLEENGERENESLN